MNTKFNFEGGKLKPKQKQNRKEPPKPSKSSSKWIKSKRKIFQESKIKSAIMKKKETMVEKEAKVTKDFLKGNERIVVLHKNCQKSWRETQRMERFIRIKNQVNSTV